MDILFISLGIITVICILAGIVISTYRYYIIPEGMCLSDELFVGAFMGFLWPITLLVYPCYKLGERLALRSAVKKKLVERLADLEKLVKQREQERDLYKKKKQHTQDRLYDVGSLLISILDNNVSKKDKAKLIIEYNEIRKRKSPCSCKESRV